MCLRVYGLLLNSAHLSIETLLSLVEVYNLAKQDAFDYLVIESTGISEPLQVRDCTKNANPLKNLVVGII